MINLTKKWLQDNHAGKEVIKVFCKQEETNVAKFVEWVIQQEKLDWANWLIARALSKPNQLKYVVYAAKVVLNAYEEAKLNNDKTQKALSASIFVLDIYDDDTNYEAACEITAKVAEAANEAYKVAYTAYSIAHAAQAIAYSAIHNFSVDTTARVDRAAKIANTLASEELQAKIVRYGLSLLKNEDKHQKEETDDRL